MTGIEPAYSAWEKYCLVDIAAIAAGEFRRRNQEQVDRIVEAMVRTGVRAAAELASVAIEETGFGVFEWLSFLLESSDTGEHYGVIAL